MSDVSALTKNLHSEEALKAASESLKDVEEERHFTKEDMEAAFAEGVHAGITIDHLPTPRTRFKEWMQKKFKNNQK